MRRTQDLNGFFLNFPATIHASAVLSTRCPRARLQEAFINVFQSFNSKAGSIPNITDELLCDMRFEVGVAHAVTFHYLDGDEAVKLKRRITVEAFPNLDFLIICCYYVCEGGKRKPLKFDRHLLRLTFYREALDIRVFHERGPRRTPLEALLKFIVNGVNAELDGSGLPRINIHSIKAV